ncbi:uncharacterized protein SETTUDRAFT_163615 [Exserohilum turcica Et28A]|uniref:Uncharacterized protein n=1 Tax=Exserohilum turcicum (strain 28A) TaxID=671987 RepID=R0IHW1_EXST2|nr:uncharacterized protein SETTUDRAFT_163615 [Exserohilum turcica Et28A]EOA84775.1 hypothetical protein SETTUDRAFT_163615 [Exserohilum turcica Et28A]
MLAIVTEGASTTTPDGDTGLGNWVWGTLPSHCRPQKQLYIDCFLQKHSELMYELLAGMRATRIE